MGYAGLLRVLYAGASNREYHAGKKFEKVMKPGVI